MSATDEVRAGTSRSESATDELRRMLDERGVEWHKTPHYSSESQDNETVFEGNGIEWYANDHLNGRLGLRAARYELTPEQAIAATLGRGTCTADELADCVTACCNLAARHGIDLQAAIDRVREKNEERGRYA